MRKQSKKKKSASTTGNSRTTNSKSNKSASSAPSLSSQRRGRASAVQEYKKDTGRFLESLEKSYASARTPTITTTSCHGNGSIIKAIEESVSFLCQAEQQDHPALLAQYDDILKTLISPLRDAIHGRRAVGATYPLSHPRHAGHQYFLECLQHQLVKLEQRATPLLKVQPSSKNGNQAVDNTDDVSEDDESSTPVSSRPSIELKDRSARPNRTKDVHRHALPEQKQAPADPVTIQHLLNLAVAVGDWELVRRVLRPARITISPTSPTIRWAMSVACFLGRIQVVDALVQAGCPIEGSCYDGQVPLFCAATGGHIHLVEHLVKIHRANVNIPCGLGTSLDFPEVMMRDMPVLCQVARLERADLPMVECLLSFGANVNERCARTGATALICASANSNPNMEPILELLIRAGADINAQTFAGLTPLFHAAFYGNVQTVRCLLRHGANASIRTNNGYFLPIHAACRGGHREVVKLLVDYSSGCNLDALDRDHCSPLIMAVSLKHTALALELIQRGADVNHSDKVGHVLHEALRSQQYELVPHLLEHGADVNAQESDGESPLHALCRHKDSPLSILNLLIEYGANPNARMITDDSTPVMWAVLHGNMLLVKGLFVHGADMFVTCKRFDLPPIFSFPTDEIMEHIQTYLKIMCRNDDVDRCRGFVRFLLSPQTSIRRVCIEHLFPGFHNECIEYLAYWAVFCNSVKILAEIVGQQFDINTRFEDGNTLLTLAASKDHTLESLHLLLAKGADPNVRDTAGHAPLHIASFKGHTSFIAPLIEAGADIDARLEKGVPTSRCSIHLACEGGHLETVQVLLDCGCGIDIPDQIGNTPLLYAIANDRIEVARALIDRGSPVDTPALRPPLHFALRSKEYELVLLLLQKGANVNAKCQLGETPLHALCRYVDAPADFVDELIKRGADVNSKRTMDGATPLHLARSCKNNDIAKRLLKHRADWFLQCHNGIPARLSMRGESENEVYVYFNDVCQRDDVDRFRSILRFYSKEQVIQADIWRRAVWFKSTKIIRSMVDEEVFKISSRLLEDGASLLHYASGCGLITVVDVLLELGANVNQRNSEGCTPLHVAARCGHAPVLHRLLKSPGADVNARSFHSGGPSVLCTAVQSQKMPAVEVLVNHGTKIDHLALDFANLYGTAEILVYLRQASGNALASRSLPRQKVGCCNGYEHRINPLGLAETRNLSRPQAEARKDVQQHPRLEPEDWLIFLDDSLQHATIAGATVLFVYMLVSWGTACLYGP
jgi:ankyrin repeat protein